MAKSEIDLTVQRAADNLDALVRKTWLETMQLMESIVILNRDGRVIAIGPIVPSADKNGLGKIEGLMQELVRHICDQMIAAFVVFEAWTIFPNRVPQEVRERMERDGGLSREEHEKYRTEVLVIHKHIRGKPGTELAIYEIFRVGDLVQLGDKVEGHTMDGLIELNRSVFELALEPDAPGKLR